MTSSGARHDYAPEWRSLYEAAILELDGRKLLERIDQAQQAIQCCLNTFEDGDGLSEKESLNNALLVLSDLRKIGSEKGQSDAA